MKYGYKFITAFALLVILVILPITVNADMGPKPSVVINFKGLENEKYYVTLLSQKSSTGPYSAYDKEKANSRYRDGDEEYEIWLKFVSYQDKSRYHFLQYFKDCSETSQFSWGYYPPYKFKILIYFPEYDKFIVSGIYEKYAFDSYYEVNMEGLSIQSVTQIENVKKNYDYKWELISLVIRIVATIAIEVVVALLFGFIAKKQILIICSVNIATQSLLNILLNVINYKYGSFMFVANYILLELFVLIIEAVVFYLTLHKFSKNENRRKGLAVLYALTANVVSFGIGLVIAFFIPGVF